MLQITEIPYEDQFSTLFVFGKSADNFMILLTKMLKPTTKTAFISSLLHKLIIFQYSM